MRMTAASICAIQRVGWQSPLMAELELSRTTMITQGIIIQKQSKQFTIEKEEIFSAYRQTSKESQYDVLKNELLFQLNSKNMTHLFFLLNNGPICQIAIIGLYNLVQFLMNSEERRGTRAIGHIRIYLGKVVIVDVVAQSSFGELLKVPVFDNARQFMWHDPNIIRNEQRVERVVIWSQQDIESSRRESGLFNRRNIDRGPIHLIAAQSLSVFEQHQSVQGIENAIKFLEKRFKNSQRSILQKRLLLTNIGQLRNQLLNSSYPRNEEVLILPDRELTNPQHWEKVFNKKNMDKHISYIQSFEILFRDITREMQVQIDVYDRLRRNRSLKRNYIEDIAATIDFWLNYYGEVLKRNRLWKQNEEYWRRFNEQLEQQPKLLIALQNKPVLYEKLMVQPEFAYNNLLHQPDRLESLGELLFLYSQAITQHPSRPQVQENPQQPQYRPQQFILYFEWVEVEVEGEYEEVEEQSEPQSPRFGN